MSNSKIIIACDFKNKQELFQFLRKFENESLFLKIGMQLIYSCGFEIIKELKEAGHKIFLDLKLHDIPITVFKALKSLSKYNVDFVTIHALGGKKMMIEASKAVAGTSTKLLAVTILTSMDKDDLQDINVSKETNEQINDLMLLAKKSNIAGIICSGYEAKMGKSLGLITITPGIRLLDKNNHDQKRVMTPELAISNGADYLVIGRTITESPNPFQTYQEINERIL